MKTIGVGVIVALAFGIAAHADEDDDNKAHGWLAPKFEELHSRWPKGPDGVTLYGTVVLDCGVGANGYANNCVLKSSEPNDPKLGEAAMALASLYKAREKSQGRMPLVLSVKFDTEPDWLRKPTFDQMISVFPSAAKGRGGRAIINCWVKTDGLLRSCKVLEENPPGLGFGDATLVLAPAFLMKPATRSGQSVESEISIPLTFSESNGSGGSPPITMLGEAVWARTPTMSEILAALDNKIGDKFAEGKVVFQCSISKTTGHLHSCIIVNASASMSGFKGVARSLTEKFEANKKILNTIKNDVRVNLAFSFPDMESETWSKRYLARPHWVQTVSSDPNQPLFPNEAAKAGLKKGSATVDCVMNANGAVNQCAIVSESVAGVGFGVMAQKIAEAFVANPWTEDGLPADGAHVKIPINMVLNDSEPVTASAPPHGP